MRLAAALRRARRPGRRSCAGAAADDGTDAFLEAVPQIDAEAAAHLIERLWGLRPASIKPVDGYDDRNFAVDFAPSRRCLFKCYNGVQAEGALAAQARVMGHLRGYDLRVPIPLPPRGGGDHAAAELPSGRRHLLRLQTWVPGVVLAEAPFGERTAAEIGRLCGEVAAALAVLPPADPSLQFLGTFRHNWDYYRTAGALSARTEAISDPENRSLCADVLQRYLAEVVRGPPLPLGVLHGDINWTNIVVVDEADGGGLALCDFGDVQLSARVSELATCVAYTVLGRRNHAGVARAVLRGFSERGPALGGSERAALLPAVCARLAQSLVQGAYAHRRCPDNSYLLDTQRDGWVALRALAPLLGTPEAAAVVDVGAPHPSDEDSPV